MIMDKDNLYRRINKFFEDHTFVFESNFLYNPDPAFNAEIEFKFKIVGEVDKIRIGELTTYVLVDVGILKTNNKILKMFLDENLPTEKFLQFRMNLENYLYKKLDVFDIRHILIHDIKWIGDD